MKAFQDYLPIYDGDRYCLMCRHMCPVERVTKREATTPHGWALLVASVNRGMLKWDDETIDLLYQCADCGLCQANCATDRPLPAALVAARAEIVRLGLAPKSVKDLEDKLERSAVSRQGAASRGQPSSVRRQPGDLGLFIGAAESSPRTVEAAQKLFKAAGAGEFTCLGTGRSSAYLAYTVGLWEGASQLAQETVAEIQTSGVEKVITLSAEDAHMLKHVLPELGFSLPPSMQVLELVEFLGQKVEQGQLQFMKRDFGVFTYHDPCHTPRLPGRADAARRLLAAISGSGPNEMLWRDKRAAPCGAVGGLTYTQPKLAADMARARLGEAKSTGAQVLLTDDPGCIAHLEKNSDGVRVVNLIELMAEAV